MEYIIHMHTVGGEPTLCGCVFSVDRNTYNLMMGALTGNIKLQVLPVEKENSETSAGPEEPTEA